MPVWKLLPKARDDDTHWKGYRYKRPLLVEADGEINARLKATRWYKDQFEKEPCDRSGQFCRSAFEDDNLYEALRLMPESIETEKERFPLVE